MSHHPLRPCSATPSRPFRRCSPRWALVALLLSDFGCGAPRASAGTVNGVIASFDPTTGALRLTANVSLELNDTRIDYGGVEVDDIHVSIHAFTPVAATEAFQVERAEAVDLDRELASGATLELAMLLDASGSMAVNDPTQLRFEAAAQFIDILLADGDTDATLSLYSFPRTNADSMFGAIDQWVTPTRDPPPLNGALSSIVAVSGSSTPLWDATLEVATTLVSRDGHRGVVVLTDGQDSPSARGPVDVVTERWLTDVLFAAQDPGVRLTDLLPWNWKVGRGLRYVPVWSTG